MTKQNNTDKPEPYLAPCPFCGWTLYARWIGPNPKAKCATTGCKGAQLPVLNLDVPDDIAAWNTRAPQPSAPVPERTTEHFKPPFDNCSFRMCDLPGQCRGEGKCHHPASAPVAGETRPTDDAMLDQALSERDEYHEMADRLANAIADYFLVEIGEHSNCNCPWMRALEAIENAAPQASETVRDIVIPTSDCWPEKPTDTMLEALRIGSHKDWPSDELCRVLYVALRAAVMAEQPDTHK